MMHKDRVRTLHRIAGKNLCKYCSALEIMEVKVMKKRSVTKLLSIVLAASMIATSAAPATALAAEVSVTSDDENPGKALSCRRDNSRNGTSCRDCRGTKCVRTL